MAWTLVNGQHLFHPCYERAVLVRRYDPLLFAMRLKFVFFKTRPIVLSLARATIFNSTNLSSSNRSDHPACTGGGGEQAKAINFASSSPSKIGGPGGVSRCLRINPASSPCFTYCRRTRQHIME